MSDAIAYGAWPSPLAAEQLSGDALRLAYPAVDADVVYWLEGRPSEAGRVVLMAAHPGAEPREVLSPETSVRSQVHEYGSVPYAVRDGIIVYVDGADQRLYRHRPDEPPLALTPPPAQPRGWRFSDPVLSTGGDFVICVRERHEDGQVLNDLVRIRSDGEGPIEVIWDDTDFVAAPALSPTGDRLAWIAWNLPLMPWEATTLFEADLDVSGHLASPVRHVAGAPDEAVQQPRYDARGRLHFVSDRTGWWNLYRHADSDESLCPREAEYGDPPWQSPSSYAFTATGIVCSAHVGSEGWLEEIDERGQVSRLALPYSLVGAVAASDSTVAILTGGPRDLPCIATRGRDGAWGVVRMAGPRLLDDAYLSVAQQIEFPSRGGRVARANYYAPLNPAITVPAEGAPPLIVMSHGGPTSMSDAVLDYTVQFFTTRGFAVVDVNYGGSSGFGRAYRDLLKGTWGVVDLEDCLAAADFLVGRGLADDRSLLIRGGSAGGYTTLCGLVFTDRFAAGASYYGVGDLEALAHDTHKFESRYLDWLVGPWPEAGDVYRERSPIHHLERLRTPVILLQGLEDAVVPPAQSKEMEHALAERGVPCAALYFEGEAHGFRRADTRTRALRAELAFYGKVLGIHPHGAAEDLAVSHDSALG